MTCRHAFSAATTLAALVLVSAPLLSAQHSGVRGVISDSVTGVPIAGAKARVNCQSCLGRGPSDSLGRYFVSHVSPGRHEIEFHCPSRTLLGRELVRDSVDVTLGADAIVNVQVPPGACYEPPYSERTGIFRGYWVSGFEESRFTPCADSSLGVTRPLLPGKRFLSGNAWVRFTTDAADRGVTWPKVRPNDWGSHSYFVVWRGTLVGPGTYGHMGVSAFGMDVDSVIDARAATPGLCDSK